MSTTSPSTATNPGDRATILAAIAAYFLPGPLQATNQLSLPETGLEAQVLDEILTKLKLDRRHLDSSARPKVLDELYRQILATSLPKEEATAAKQRLGMSGELRPDQYRIGFPESFNSFAKLGTRASHVEGVIRRPDAVQHLRPGRSEDPDTPLVSLFLKQIEATGPDAFFLLVEAIRRADQLSVHAAWRLYSADLSFVSVTSPLAGLAAFLEVYGLPLHLRDRQETRLVKYDALPLQGDPSSVDISQYIQVNAPPGHNVWGSQLIRISSLGVLELALVYQVDLTLYEQALRRHGVVLF